MPWCHVVVHFEVKLSGSKPVNMMFAHTMMYTNL